MKRLAIILITACLCSSCTFDYNYKPNTFLKKGQPDTEDLRLLHPQGSKWVGLFSVKDIGPSLAEVPTPEGFKISPGEVSGALRWRKFTISIYADSKEYFVLYGAGKRKPSLVRDYGFRINGRTGETALPKKHKGLLSIPNRLMNDGVQIGLKAKCGSIANKFESLFYEEFSRLINSGPSKSYIIYSGISITVTDDLKTADCNISGLRASKKVDGELIYLPVEGELKIENISKDLWEISGNGALNHIQIQVNTEKLVLN